jgi:hypothetical protein
MDQCRAIEADLDGEDGSESARLIGDGAGGWRIDVADHGAIDVSDRFRFGPDGGPSFIGATQANDQPGAELFVDVGHGASTVGVGIFTVSNDGVEPVTLDGEPLAFYVAGSVRHGGGMECLDNVGDGHPGLILRAVEIDATGDTASWSESAYRLIGSKLTAVSKDTGTFAVEGNESRRRRFYRLLCGDLDPDL